MNPAMKVAAGVTGGYLLGRHKKLRWTLGFGAALLGKRLDLNPTRLVLTGVQSLRELPEVMDLNETVRGELATSGRRAAMTLMSSRLDAVSDGLRKRTDALEPRDENEAYPDEEPYDDEIDVRDEADDDAYDDEVDDAYDDEVDDADEAPRRPARRRARASA